MFSINSKLSSSETSIFSIISKWSSDHGAINLGQGYPNFDCPDSLKEKVAFYLNQGKNQYCPMPGLLSLRKAIALKTNDAYQSQIDPVSEITITAGATQALFNTITALVKKGDEVIIIEPAYDSYRPSIEINGGIAVAYDLEAPSYKIDWKKMEGLISSKTKMIIINTPQNPIGKTLKAEDMVALENLLRNREIFLLSDEVYEHMVYDGQTHESVLKYPELFKRSICVFSFGKSLHATGWKMGYCIAPQNIMEEIRKVHQWNVFSVNSFIQFALADFLENKEHFEGLTPFYQDKRDLFETKMQASRFKSSPSEGTYFQLYDYSAISDLDDKAFTQFLIKEHGVACIPVSAFYGSGRQDKMVRFCFAKTDELLLAAAEKLLVV